MKQVGIILAMVGASIFSYAQDTASVYFKKDSYTVSNIEKDKVKNFLSQNRDCQLQLKGHTDSDGSDAYNIQLSLNRVEAVKDVLQVDIDKYDWLGERFALDESTPEPQKSGDRRVDIIAHCPVVSQVVEVEEPEEIRLKEEVQSFEIDPSIENSIVGRKGTRVIIPADAFEERDGSLCNSSVTVELKEFYTKSEFILNDLTTSSNEYLIESGGMVDLRVKGRKGYVKVAEGKELLLDFKGNQRKRGMEVFYVDDSRRFSKVAAVNMNWQPNAFSVNTYEVEYDGVIQVIGDWSSSQVERLDDGRYVEVKKNYKGLPTKLISIDTTDVTAEYEVKSEFLRTAKLGLINCDRFVGQGEYLVDQRVKQERVEGVNPSMFLVLEKYNSVMPVYKKKGGHAFPNIPYREKGKIVAVYKKGDKYFYTEKDIHASTSLAKVEEFEELSPKQFKERLAQLD